MNLRFAALLVALGAGWGLTHPLSKIAAMAGHPPFLLLFWQMVVVVVVLGGLTLLRGRRLSVTPAALRFYVVVAVLGTVVPNTTFYLSIAKLPAGVMSILLSTVPMIAFPLALATGIDRFALPRLIGLLLGLVGVVLIAGPGGGLGPGMAAAIAIALIGPLFYALEANYVARRGMAGMDPISAMTGASLVALVLCLGLVLVTGQWAWPPLPLAGPEWALVGSSTIHAVIYVAYVWLAVKAGPVFASQVSYLITATGLFWSMAILGERFAPTVWLALVLILGGMALVRPRPRKHEGIAAS